MRDGRIAEDDYFYTEQNAPAGAGCRAVLPDDVPGRGLLLESAGPAHGRDAGLRWWSTFLRNASHGEGRGLGSQLVTWAMRGRRRWGSWANGMSVNSVREKSRSRCRTGRSHDNDGTVTAASNWDAPAERKRSARPCRGATRPSSMSSVPERFLLVLRDDGGSRARQGTLLERAIGVIYRPETERTSHYFQASCRPSSTPCSTSTIRGPSSRSNERPVAEG